MLLLVQQRFWRGQEAGSGWSASQATQSLTKNSRALTVGVLPEGRKVWSPFSGAHSRRKDGGWCGWIQEIFAGQQLQLPDPKNKTRKLTQASIKISTLGTLSLNPHFSLILLLHLFPHLSHLGISWTGCASSSIEAITSKIQNAEATMSQKYHPSYQNFEVTGLDRDRFNGGFALLIPLVDYSQSRLSTFHLNWISEPNHNLGWGWNWRLYLCLTGHHEKWTHIYYCCYKQYWHGCCLACSKSVFIVDLVFLNVLVSLCFPWNRLWCLFSSRLAWPMKTQACWPHRFVFRAKQKAKKKKSCVAWQKKKTNNKGRQLFTEFLDVSLGCWMRVYYSDNYYDDLLSEKSLKSEWLTLHPNRSTLVKMPIYYYYY